jgi:hypothetical protein
MSLLKKALGAFVEFSEQKDPEAPEQGPAPAPKDGVEEGPADLSDDPDIQRVQEAIRLLASLPLSEIPVAKARELIVRTLQFAGMAPEMLIGSFQRAQEVYRSQIHSEQGLIASRKQVSAERIALLEAALKEEREQCEAEIAARTERIEKANHYLSEIEKAMAFFAAEEESR